MILDILKAMLVGVCASVPVGPIAILVIQKSLSKGHKAGFITSLGSVFVDTVFSIIAIFALAFVQDFLARRLYDMTGDILMSLLILDDATVSPDLFSKSANVYVRMAEAEVNGHFEYVQNFKAGDLEYFKTR